MNYTTTKLTGFLFICLLILAGCASKTALQGKIVIADQKLPYIAQQNILLKRNQKTAYTAKVDRFGYFEFKNVKRKNTYDIGFDTLPKALDGTVFYIANINGKKIKEIDLRKAFAFRLLPVEFSSLSSLQDDDLESMIQAFKNNASVNELLVKKNINYETGSFLISKENKGYLNTMAKILKKNDQFVIRVNSHADAIGDDEFNKTLSVKRANEIKNYLVMKGISTDRIFAYGYGETKPLNNCTNGVNCSELQHRQNRRTEFVFMTKATKRSSTEVVLD